MGVCQGEKAWKNQYRKSACMLIYFSHVWLFATLWTIAYQAPLSMGFSRQENWSGLPFTSPGDLPIQRLNPGLPHCRQTLLPSEPQIMVSNLGLLNILNFLLLKIWPKLQNQVLSFFKLKLSLTWVPTY